MMLKINFTDFPVLKTERLVLRQATDADAQHILELRGNETAMRFIPRPRAKNLNDALEHIKVLTEGIHQGININWAICLAEKPAEIIGMMGYVRFNHEQKKAEIGYMLHPNFWGNSYVPEAMASIENYGFQVINLQAIEAIIDPRNENSKKVLLRNNYKLHKSVQNELTFQGEELDSEYYIKYKMQHLP